MGLGVKTGIDTTGEVAGLVPDKAWKEAYMRRVKPNDSSEWRWYDGETVVLSIGQGSASITPLQTAVMMASIVNGGRLVQPHLNADRSRPASDVFISEANLALIQAGMRKCVEKETFPTGTGKLAKIPGMVILGKTGSAQVVSIKAYEDLEEEEIPYGNRDHAWFVAGVLDQDPPIAVAVLVEHGLHGSSAAAPLAKSVIEYFYSNVAPRVMVAHEEDSG